MHKERPILFNADMVRALLDGRKTQTRRVVKPKRGWPIDFVGGVGMENDPTCWGFENGDGEWWSLKGDERCSQIPCPYGQPGDRLWVREAFAYGLCTESTLAYRATHKPSDLEEGWYEPIKWKPSIHMPRWASRITLEIVSVRVERLCSISNEDAISEGIGAPLDMRYAALDGFKPLWVSINGADSWDANPWVWVVEFKCVEASQ